LGETLLRQWLSKFGPQSFCFERQRQATLAVQEFEKKRVRAAVTGENAKRINYLGGLKEGTTKSVSLKDDEKLETERILWRERKGSSSSKE
jgi:hypothetical protein